MPHTAAPLDQRLGVSELLLSRHPDAGWSLVLDLLPHGSDSVMNNPTPEWRFWAEGWKRGVPRAERGRAVAALVRVAVSHANDHPKKWPALIERLPQWPRSEFEYAVEALERLAETSLAEEIRRELWTSLFKQTRTHRYFSDADWALPEEALASLETVRDRLEPSDAVAVATPLFGDGFESVGHNLLPWEEQE